MTPWQGGKDDAASGPPLVLRLVRSRGLPRTGAFAVPPGGAGLAAALNLGGAPLSPLDSEDADRCFIARVDGQWMLSNQSHSWVCALNGQRIGVGKRPALFDGDVLELGLLRFEVDAMHGAGHGIAEAAPPPWMRLGERDPLPHAADETIAEFDLRHRARPSDSTW
ncbi:FHA domain-containing protein [Variovorax sp. LT2P21]|uniref:FHA domain-containing protein n=1 Tax=Variovorax sp. LT2P21 TaxID=3443731 RepID=UPI003F47C6A4